MCIFTSFVTYFFTCYKLLVIYIQIKYNILLPYIASYAKLKATKERDNFIMEFNILHFGAIGDGTTNDTPAIQAAIDACAAAGGGKVIFPGGKTYRSGAITLCSNLELHLEMGAVLKGSDNLEDYLLYGNASSSIQKRAVPSYVNCEYAGAPTHYFLYAKDCENLAITGFGRIDGNEEIFHGEVTPWHIEGIFYPRAPMLFLENVAHLTIRDVTLEKSAFWTVHMVGCKDVLIDGIRILNSMRMANCDGIDPDHCQNVRIANCHIECADDCIVFKNTAAAMQYGPCENITVTNCTLSSSSAAIKFGSESEALFRNILIENCVISHTNRAISLQLRDKGSIENVIFNNLVIQTELRYPNVFWGAAEPIAITVFKRKEDTEVGRIQGILFHNIRCEGENGILMYAEQPGAISDVTFQNVSLSLRQFTDYEKGRHDLRPNTHTAFTEDGLAYVHAHGVHGAQFRYCTFRAEADMQPAQQFLLQNCQAVEL